MKHGSKGSREYSYSFDCVSGRDGSSEEEAGSRPVSGRRDESVARQLHVEEVKRQQEESE